MGILGVTILGLDVGTSFTINSYLQDTGRIGLKKGKNVTNTPWRAGNMLNLFIFNLGS
jgi:hypothetical protein